MPLRKGGGLPAMPILPAFIPPQGSPSLVERPFRRYDIEAG